jgi:Na+-exporting ATPase
MMAPNPQKAQRTDRHPFLLPVYDVANQLGTNVENGLSARKVAELREKCPPNELVGGGGIVWYKILTKQLSNAMILVRFLVNPLYFMLTLIRSLFLQWL